MDTICRKVQNYGLHFWKNVVKFLLVIGKFSLPCGIMGMVFIIFVEFWVAFVQTWAELRVQILNQNGMPPSKTRLSYPPPRA